MSVYPAGVEIERSAVFSKDNLYRYELWRWWDDYKPPLIFVGLNPSTADAMKDDATIRRLVGFARLWGHGSLSVFNLFAYRATDPKDLIAYVKRGRDAVGPRNDYLLAKTLMDEGNARLVIGWGESASHPLLKPRADHILSQLKLKRRDVYYFKKTKSGQPSHPLYLPSGAPLIRW